MLRLTALSLTVILSACSSVTTVTIEKETVKDWTAFSANEQLSAMKTGELSSEELVAAYLNRIEKYDRQGPSIQAVLSINPNA